MRAGGTGGVSGAARGAHVTARGARHHRARAQAQPPSIQQGDDTNHGRIDVMALASANSGRAPFRWVVAMIRSTLLQFFPPDVAVSSSILLSIFACLSSTLA